MSCLDMMIEEYKMLWEEIHELKEELNKKEKTFIELILRNYARREWSETVKLGREKTPSNSELCTLQNSPSKERNKEFL